MGKGSKAVKEGEILKNPARAPLLQFNLWPSTGRKTGSQVNHIKY
jgi:hypothetical protein